MYEIKGKNMSLVADEQKATFKVLLENGDIWTMSGRPYVALTSGEMLYLDEAEVTASERNTGIGHGYGADYNFGNGLVLHTLVYFENTRDDLFFVNRLEGDAEGQVDVVSFPAPVDFNAEAGHGYTVLSRMQGTLMPAGEPIVLGAEGIVYERDAYMPIFGQVRDGSGYLAIFDTPFDAKYAPSGENAQNVQPLFRTSLGKMSYPRRMLYRFSVGCDYNSMAQSYRKYLSEHGEVYTLAAKVKANPSLEKLFGRPVIHTGIAKHVSPESIFYRADKPEYNDHFTSFETRADQLKALKARGLDKAYVHLDGWGNHGYDNLHPDPFPPHEAAGGAEGMKKLSEVAEELDYIFGVHDQYRDYYYDAPTFDMNNAIENVDGSHPFCSIWDGGSHTYLCASLAPAYVRRNYDEFERLGIKIKASYLDVFSVVSLDECFNAEHRMTREQCAAARNECLNILTERGIIPSSEETLGCMMRSQVLCHHAPFFTAGLEYVRKTPAVGIPIPLFNMVNHDCVVIPWVGLTDERGGWGIPGNDSAYTHAILNGNPVYCPIEASEEQIAAIKVACDSAKRLTHERIVRHEFLSEDKRRQRTVWSDGTVIDVDFDTNEYTIKLP